MIAGGRVQQTFLMARIDTMAHDKSRRYRAIKIGHGAELDVLWTGESFFFRMKVCLIDSGTTIYRIYTDRERNQLVFP